MNFWWERTGKVQRDKTMRRISRTTAGTEGTAEKKALRCTGSYKEALDLWTEDRNRY